MTPPIVICFGLGFYKLSYYMHYGWWEWLCLGQEQSQFGLLNMENPTNAEEPFSFNFLIFESNGMMKELEYRMSHLSLGATKGEAKYGPDPWPWHMPSLPCPCLSLLKIICFSCFSNPTTLLTWCACFCKGIEFPFCVKIYSNKSPSSIPLNFQVWSKITMDINP